MCWHWILTRGSYWVSIDAVWNREVFCYGCQCSESDWTQGANVIYWCSAGPRSPWHGKQAGSKTHKWDIDHIEGVDEKKKVIFNHGVAHLVYRVVNTLSASLARHLNATFNRAMWRSAARVLMATHQIACREPGWQHLKVFKWKERYEP